MDADSTQSLARPLKPEDIAPRQYVAVLHVVDEYLPLLCAPEGDFSPPREVRRFALVPEQPVELMQVIDVCLPFVLVKMPDGRRATIDVRRHRLARVDDDFGKRVFKHAPKAESS